MLCTPRSNKLDLLTLFGVSPPTPLVPVNTQEESEEQKIYSGLLPLKEKFKEIYVHNTYKKYLNQMQVIHTGSFESAVQTQWLSAKEILLLNSPCLTITVLE